jgi:hypothetical protein
VGSFTSAAPDTTQPRLRTHRTEHGVVAAFVGLLLAMYAVIGYGMYTALAALL